MTLFSWTFRRPKKFHYKEGPTPEYLLRLKDHSLSRAKRLDRFVIFRNLKAIWIDEIVKRIAKKSGISLLKLDKNKTHD